MYRLFPVDPSVLFKIYFVSNFHVVQKMHVSCVSRKRKIRQCSFLYFITHLGSTKDRSYLSWNVSQISSKREFLTRLFPSDKSLFPLTNISPLHRVPRVSCLFLITLYYIRIQSLQREMPSGRALTRTRPSCRRLRVPSRVFSLL